MALNVKGRGAMNIGDICTIREHAFAYPNNRWLNGLEVKVVGIDSPIVTVVPKNPAARQKLILDKDKETLCMGAHHLLMKEGAT